MAFIVKNRWKYFELVRNIRKEGKHKRELLFYMGTTLHIPKSIILEKKISTTNIEQLKIKHPSLIIEN